MSEHKISIAAITILLAVVACGQGMEQSEADTVPIRLVYSDSQCNTKAAGIDPIRDSDALAAWWLPLSRQQVPPKDLPQGLAAIDFATSSVFVVSMGSKPTPGYAIDLHSHDAPVQAASLTIPAEWTAPPADAALAQLLTSPCAVFAVPVGQYQTVVVRDRQGARLLPAININPGIHQP